MVHSNSIYLSFDTCLLGHNQWRVMTILWLAFSFNTKHT
nr:MAG TPA: hypothetical protein [Caudoviricetes sp.]